eukprot:6534925-Prorocentrum_lima.AAC.1
MAPTALRALELYIFCIALAVTSRNMEKKKYCAFLQSMLPSHDYQEKHLEKQLRDLMLSTQSQRQT